MADIDVEEVLSRLHLREKCSLTAGRAVKKLCVITVDGFLGSDFWHTAPIPRLNLPALRTSDGPNGLRGISIFNGTPAACVPCATALGATFNKELLRKVGQLLGDEAKAKGVHVLLGPTVNIQRAPIGGRGFESFSEDPLLSGTLAGEYCNGVQEKGIMTTPKHFVCNDQEHERMAVNSIVTDRALREIYLLPFMLAIRKARPAAIMTAYNKVNGIHASENSKLFEILRNDWQWEGLVMSDWFGTYSTPNAINAGLDLEMPGPTRWRGGALPHAVTSNKIKGHVLDDRVRAVLRLIKLASKSGVPSNAPERQLNREQDRSLLRLVAAESIVLLKNERAILPFDKTKPVAVMGANATSAAYCGGGSASLVPYYAVTPLEGVSAQSQSTVRYALGAYGHKELPPLGKELQTLDGKPGFKFKCYDKPPDDSDRKLLDELHLTNSNIFLMDYKVPHMPNDSIFYVDIVGIFVPKEDGIYDFGLTVEGTARLFVDGSMLIDNATEQRPGTAFFGAATVEERANLELQAGKAYSVKVEFGSGPTSTLERPAVVSFGAGGLRFGCCKRLDPESEIAKAVQLASEVEQVVIFAGLNGEWESEGFDRPDMDSPPHIDQLIKRILEVNPKAVIVLQSGCPVAMPWADDSGAIMQAWYGGNETGNGIADVLYGDVNPAGKLPLTFPRYLSQNPAFLNFRSERGRVLYGEDVYVGYRYVAVETYYDKTFLPPLFPFGHGLSYTSFDFSDLELACLHFDAPASSSEALISVTCCIKNTGTRGGAEVAQVYIQHQSPSISRPVKELKGFTKVFLEPGQKERVTVDIERKYACSFWDEGRDMWTLEDGKYKVLVGNSSRASFLVGRFEVGRTGWWSGL